MNLEKLFQENRGTIIDVRTQSEYTSGHVTGSINIPLQEIPQRIEELKKLNTPIILCCASGGRSSLATQMLSKQGIPCHNGGSWLDLNYYQSQIVS